MSEDEPSRHYSAVAEAVVKQVLSAEAKLRWEELEEFPFVQDSIMSLETLFGEEPLEVAQGAQLSKEVFHPRANIRYL